jgi:dihydrolipoamide dehydrogenase
VKKIIVIGGGPGGYVAAIRGAQLGATVTLVENKNIGGVCLNWGCIPTKTLLTGAKYYSIAKKAAEYGVEYPAPSLNFEKLQSKKAQVVKQLSSGVATLLKANAVEVIMGEAKLLSAKAIEVNKKDRTTVKVEGDAIIVATGSRPFMPPIEGIKSKGVMDSTDLLDIKELPKEIVILGGGVLGVEFATLLASLGTKVTMVEMLPVLLPREDEEISMAIKAHLEKLGVKVLTGKKLLKIEEKLKGLTLHLDGETLDAEYLLVAVGRVPNTENIGLESIGVKTIKGFIDVNQYLETSLRDVYAIGDCTGKALLAHVASHQGIVAAENIMGHKEEIDYKVIPNNIYTSPEIASVGLTEKEAKEKYKDILVGRFPLFASGKAIADGATEGFIKIIAEPKYQEVVGLHIFGERATDLISEGVMAMGLEATLKEIHGTIHGHPTFNEGIVESALDAIGIAIHLPPKRK